MPYKDEDKKKSYQKDWMISRRMAWIESQGGMCVVCGSVENLEVDHIDPSTKKVNPRQLWSLSPANPLRIEELGKCQILCYTCHKEKTRQEKSKEYSHGDYGMYSKRKCRCDLCRGANAARKRREREKKKLEDI